MASINKLDRILQIYSRLTNGQIIKTHLLAQEFQVAERSIQRDLESLRCYFSDYSPHQALVYESISKGYRLQGTPSSTLTNGEILAVCKILLESRSLCKDEMLPILDNLVANCTSDKNKSSIVSLIANESHHYIEPHHHKYILHNLWTLAEAIRNHQMVEIEYERMKEPNLVHRLLKPVGIMFSEYYFYLTAFLENVDKSTDFDNADDLFPTIYRIDRILSFEVLNRTFEVPYAQRFEEGEFRKRVQFMYGGKLQLVRFKYNGPSVDAVLDRLPTAEIIAHDQTGWTIHAEVFGSGINMWLRSQGEYVKILT